MRTFLLLSLTAGTILTGAGAFAADPAATQGADTWRASKLIGVPIYGPGNASVGKISDVLMSHEGKASTLVVGVGGLLGIGEKDVALPFDQVTFTDTPLVPPVNPAAAPANNMAATGTAAAPGNAAGPQPASPAGTSDASAPPPPPSTAYPDHGTITLTKDDLKGMPTFQFAK